MDEPVEADKNMLGRRPLFFVFVDHMRHFSGDHPGWKLAALVVCRAGTIGTALIGLIHAMRWLHS